MGQPVEASEAPKVSEALEVDGPIKVVALRTGLYKCVRIPVGREFMIDCKAHLGSWMKKV